MEGGDTGRLRETEYMEMGDMERRIMWCILLIGMYEGRK